MTIVDGVAVVRYAHRGAHNTAIDNSPIAFDLADGHVLWDRVLSPYTAREDESGHKTELQGLPLYISDLAVGQNLVSFANAGDARNEVATSTNARSGTVGWSHAIPVGWSAPVVYGESYATHYVQSTLMTDARTGDKREHDVTGPGCVIGTEYVVVEDTGETHRLVAYASATSEPRVIASAFTAFEGYTTVLACGRYLDRFVFLIETDFQTHRIEAVITGPDGALLHRVFLSAGVSIVDDDLQTDPVHATFGGDLPRFVLYPLERSTLVMVDLETGTIAWRGKQNSTPLYGSLFHRGTRWIWIDAEGAEPTIAVFDGTTGKLQGAVDAYSYQGVLSLGRASRHIATSDTLWLYAGDWATPGDAAIANIDLATLKTRYVRTIRLTDSTAAVRRKLGI